jgi:hypothetical protein
MPFMPMAATFILSLGEMRLFAFSVEGINAAPAT